MWNWRNLIFFSAAETLSEIWSRTVDGHDVDAQAVPLNQKFTACATIAVPTSDCEMSRHYMLHALRY